MKITNSPDKRPAIAFDSKEEVQQIIDSLSAFRYSHISRENLELDEIYRKLTDEYEKVFEMFKGETS